jgi:signal transduction histidine kinase
MIDDLLILARYEGGETELPSEPVRLDEVLESVVASLQPIIAAKEIGLHARTEAVTIAGDARAIERLASNLIVNALRYSPRQSRVSLRVEPTGGCANLIVEDQGIGIAPDELPHIFDRFYRSPTARTMHPEGYGIGLAVANVIAKLHGGKIAVASEEHQGTRFVVSLPLSPAKSNPV